MTREEFAKRFRWDTVVWLAGFANVVALLPQPFKILEVRDVSALSPTMFLIFLGVQVTFAVEGYIKKSYGMFFSMGVSAALSTWILYLIWYFR